MRWGLHLAERGGRHAVARRLAVLLHRLRVTKQPYVPLCEPQAAYAGEALMVALTPVSR